MYCRAESRWDDVPALLAHLEAHPFATVVGVADGTILSSSLPVLAQWTPAPPRPGQIVSDGRSLTLIGHVAAGNPLQRASALHVIGHGPHAYVSATWYDEPDLVPTWNYVEVQASGPVTWLPTAAAPAILAALARQLEGVERAPWQERLSEARAQALQQAIRCFRMDITALHGIRKLSQNRTPAQRARVIAALAARTPIDADAGKVAEAMAALEPRAP